MTSTPPDLLLSTLEAILEIDALDLGQALSAAADRIAAAMRADKIDVFLYDAAKDTIVAVGASHTPMGIRQRALGLDRLPLSHGGRAAQVYRTREPFMTGDAASDREEVAALARELGVRSVIDVPFAIGQTGRHGVLSIASAEPNRYGERDLRFAKALGRWCGMVAHRAELVERVAAASREEGRRGAAEEIVTVVAHDLRNYVGPVLGRVQLLSRRAARENRERDLHDAQAAERSLKRVTGLLSDLLDVTRVDQGLFELAPVPLDLVAVLTELAGALAEPTKRVEVKAPTEVVVTADAARLRQAFENLLANAVKHAPAGTAVTVEVEAAGDTPSPWVDVIISNPGAAIAPELLPRLFDRFVRGGNSSGLGLGLYLAREIVVAHGGTVAAEPVAAGARFRVRLPGH